jgi:hypothetical protein
MAIARPDTSLHRVAKVRHWNEDANCEGTLIYTTDGLVDSWLASDHRQRRATVPTHRRSSRVHPGVPGGGTCDLAWRAVLPTRLPQDRSRRTQT